MSRRLGFGAAAASLGILLAAYPVLDSRVPAAAVLSLGLPAAAVYLAALLRLWPGGLPVALALFALEYLAALYLRGGRVDLLAPAYAAGLFVCAELGWLTLESGGGQGAWPSRLLGGALLVCGGLLIGVVVLAITLLPLPAGPLLTAAGLLAAVAASAGLGWLARSSAGGERQF